MPKPGRTKAGESIMRGMQEALEHLQGKRPLRTTIVHVADAKAIRRQLRMSQQEFAKAYRIPLRTLQGWEQGQRQPDAPAVAYLQAIARLPKQIKSAIGE
jgi:putative transcriptional regulator